MEVYAIPFAGQMAIYKPRRHLAFLGNAALAHYIKRRGELTRAGINAEIEQFLETVGFDRPVLECAPPTVLDEALHPTNVVLLMTNRCNLRCTYCYANAGEEPTLVEMQWETAQVGIDFALANARRSGADSPALTFHGGGEPTVPWDLLVRATDYAKGHDRRMQVSMSSNGVWSPAQREYICARFDNVSLSMDGNALVQNRQRPRADGGPSFPAVMESVAALDAAGVDYGIRVTVLPESVDALPEGIRFLCERTGARSIQVEPSFTSSRGRYGDLDLDFAAVFPERFMEAWQIGREAERQVYYSGARPWVIAPLFCQAPLKAAVVTADGRLVTCFEVFSEQSPMAGSFTVGRIIDGQVVHERAALQGFLDAQEQRRQECVDCFCYWHCCGDCATRRPEGGNTHSGRCRATRSVTLAMLAAYLEEGEGIWQGLRETPMQMAPACDESGDNGEGAPISPTQE